MKQANIAQEIMSDIQGRYYTQPGRRFSTHNTQLAMDTDTMSQSQSQVAPTDDAAPQLDATNEASISESEAIMQNDNNDANNDQDVELSSTAATPDVPHEQKLEENVMEPETNENNDKVESNSPIIQTSPSTNTSLTDGLATGNENEQEKSLSQENHVSFDIQSDAKQEDRMDIDKPGELEHTEIKPIFSDTNNNNDDEEEEESVSPMITTKSDTDHPVKEEQPSAEENISFPQFHEIVIPSYSSWFNLKKIHKIEKKSLPEFFTNRIPSKTPQVYVRYRNFMVNSYRINPNEYFTVTVARRNLSGDAAMIFRIHRFLNKWGLINYQVNPKLLPKNVEPPYTSEYSTKHDAPRGLFPFESFKPSLQLPDLAKLKKMMDLHDEDSPLYKYLLEQKNDTIKKEHGNEPKEPELLPDHVLTDETNKRKSTDTEHILPPAKKRVKILESTDDNWNKEELAKLLKGLQTHGSNWFQVAKDIGNKTPEQCILKFLQLPIEDKFLYQSSPSDENSKTNNLGPLNFAPHLPFSNSDNPVLSTIAFLVGLVDPKIVQSMTNRAIRQLEGEEIGNKEQDEKTKTEEEIEEKVENIQQDKLEEEEQQENKEQEQDVSGEADQHNEQEDQNAKGEGAENKNQDPEQEQEQEQLETKEEAQDQKQEISNLPEPAIAKETKDKEEPIIDAVPDVSAAPGSPLKEGSEIAFSTLGVRSKVFANNEERKLIRLSNQMVQIQLRKVETKMNLINKLEKTMELEKKVLERQQEDLLIQRLTFNKNSKKLLEKFQSSLESFDNKEILEQNINEIKSLLTNPAQLSFGKPFNSSVSISRAEAESNANASESEIKPISIEAPQFYRYWSA